MALQLGAFFPTRDMPPDRVAIRDWAQAAEGLGFDYLEVPDHVLGVNRSARPDFQGPYDADDSFHEVFATLSYLAGVTDDVGLASAVVILPQRQTPLVAKQAAQLDILCSGRLRLGIGVGWNPVEFEALGQVWASRGRRQAEQIRLLKRLWTEHVVTFEGEFDTLRDVGINPRPVQRPIPIWLGGGADATLERAARHGDGWIPLGEPDARMKDTVGDLRRRVAAAGRDPQAFGIEGWVRSSLGSADAWGKAVEAWQELGATHATFYTSGLGIGEVPAQIEAMRGFMAAAPT